MSEQIEPRISIRVEHPKGVGMINLTGRRAPILEEMVREFRSTMDRLGESETVSRAKKPDLAYLQEGVREINRVYGTSDIAVITELGCPKKVLGFLEYVGRKKIEAPSPCGEGERYTLAPPPGSA